MKRLFSTNEWKHLQESRARDSLRKTQKKKSPHKKRKGVAIVRGHLKYVEPLDAPKNFSLINNTEKLLQYFNKARELLKDNTPVKFLLEEITNLTPDAIAFFIAHFNDKKFSNGIKLSGTEPSDKTLRTIIRKSGFFDHVQSRVRTNPGCNNLLLHKITNNKVENTIARQACELALSHLGISGKFRPLYETIIELMANTNNHAGDERGMYDWWIFVYNNDEGRSCITFLDLGVGIFESIPVKKWQQLQSYFLGNSLLVDTLLKGEISSRTNLPERGRGIPLIGKHAKHAAFDKFIMISNDVYADLKSDTSKTLKTPFEGTLYHIEICNAE